MEVSEYFPVWDKLSAEQQNKLTGSAIRHNVKKGTMVHGGAEECLGLLLIRSGQLRAYICSEEGREITLYRLFERDICLFSASCMLHSIQFEIFIEAEKDTELWIIPTVGCVNGVAAAICKRFSAEMARYPYIEAVKAFTHNYGCSQLGDDHQNTRHILADMVHHPNAAGVLVVSLGCENNQLSAFRELVGSVDESRVKFMESQKIAGDEVEYGLRQLREIAGAAASDRREDIPVSELKVGLKCGGSDGFSGITANPLLGRFSDWIVSQGGTTVLTEVPEMFGAETLLMARCRDRETFDRTVHLINGFKEYFIRNGQPVYENPSPGNKAGGISTLEEKSLGCTQKSGKSNVNGVLEYGERLSEKGLNLLSAPGNDLVAATALAASGCQIVLFTTGRGTPFGTFVPTAKISSNTHLAVTKPGWIDFNAGVIVDGKATAQTDDEFIDFVLSVASGTPVCNEKAGYSEIAIFKTGVTL